MKSDWINDLSDDEVDEFEKRLKRNKIILDKLSKICYNKLSDINRPNKKDYESPSWAYRQAHDNGAAEAYRYLIDLLTLDQRE